MRLIDDVDLTFQRSWRITHAIKDLTHIINAGVAGGIHLLHIEIGTIGNAATGSAGAARLTAIRIATIDRHRHESRNCGFADTANATEQIGMCQISAEQ